MFMVLSDKFNVAGTCNRRYYAHKKNPVNGVIITYVLAARESDCSRMRRKVSSDWLPSFVKATRPVLEILNMAGFFWDRPRTVFIKINTSIAGLRGKSWCCTLLMPGLLPSYCNVSTISHRPTYFGFCDHSYHHCVAHKATVRGIDV
jgi:hypothetical protein